MSNITDISGDALIGGREVRGAGNAFYAHAAATGEALPLAFHGASAEQVALACELAGAAFDSFRATPDLARANLLDTIAAQILALGDVLIERAVVETGLPRARIEGERGRTVSQLAMFANLLREGSWRQVAIDSALPERTPPRPDLRMGMIALGPVAVFGASNFPLAFSVAGGDTASALAAGCPVVLKGHAAHPGTSELVARAIVEALRLCAMPAGVFALLPGADNAVGEALVRHPAIAAVGFTGSRQGGLALLRIAQARPVPIPVYAEMSAINPVFLLPGALRQRGDTIAKAFATSLTMSVGQLCTNPGLVLGLAGPDFDRFAQHAADAVAALAAGPAAPMLTASIGAAYARGVGQLASRDGVATLAGEGAAAPGRPALFVTKARDFLRDGALSNEVFGPAALLVAADDLAQLRQVAEHLEGQLTATLQLDENDAGEHGDLAAARSLVPILERKVGRLLANGFPTGVEVSAAMVHGGPFPATTDGRSTSVGATAIHRFTRPVSYQNMPQQLLAPALRDNTAATDEAAKAPAGWRLRDGVYAQA
jgi:NADP-dependent aldehyde dehydrogenase